MESFLVMVPEEWMMLASSSFMMKLTVFCSPSRLAFLFIGTISKGNMKEKGQKGKMK
jgi:hypothetical protein